MARIRTIKPEFWEDEKLAKLPVYARLLFIGTWNFADDNGGLLANPVLMKSHIFPYEDIGISTISEWIDILVENGMLIRTTYNGKDYLVIRKFLIHQKINRKSIRINLPLPVVLKVIDEYNKTHGVLTEPSLQEREQGIGKRNDGTGMEEEMKEESAPVGRPIHRRRTRKGCAISEVLQEIAPVPPFSKEVKSKNDPLGMSALLSVMPDPIGHPSLAEFIDELLRLRIFLVIYPHHLLNSVGNPRACLRMTFDPPDTPSVLLFIFSCFSFAILFTGISPSLLWKNSYIC